MKKYNDRELDIVRVSINGIIFRLIQYGNFKTCEKLIDEIKEFGTKGQIINFISKIKKELSNKISISFKKVKTVDLDKIVNIVNYINEELPEDIVLSLLIFNDYNKPVYVYDEVMNNYDRFFDYFMKRNYDEEINKFFLSKFSKEEIRYLISYVIGYKYGKVSSYFSKYGVETKVSPY